MARILVNKMPTHPSGCRFAYQIHYVGEVPKNETWYCRVNRDKTCELLCLKKECECLISTSNLKEVNNAGE